MDKILFSKLSPEIKTRYNHKMINVLKIFISFCEKHRLRYSLAYGSVLGAVRHKGIIPWDYDVDVYMPRPDYLKFIDIFDRQGPEGYHILTPQKTSFYPEPFAKIADSNTSLVFTKFFPVDYGIFIDIFPLDGASSNIVDCKKDYVRFNFLIRLFRLCQTSMNLKESLQMIYRGGYKHVFLSILVSPFKKTIRYYCIKKAQKIYNNNQYGVTDNVIQYRDDSYGLEKSWFPRKWIEDTIEVPFENITARIPKDFDDYLRHYYGDYMQLPPEDKRDDRHAIDYLNLDEREPINDILSKLENK